MLAIVAASFGQVLTVALDDPSSGSPGPLVRLALVALAVAALGVAPVAWLFSRRQMVKDGALVITREALSFDGEPLCDRASIESALVIPQRSGKPVIVVRRRRGGPLRVEVPDVEQGRAILRALELDPLRNVATFDLPTMKQGLRAAVFAVASVIGLLALVAAPALQTATPLLAVLGSVVAYLAFLLAGRTTLHVGADGLRIHSFFRTRFLAHDEIAAIALLRSPYRGVELTLRSGEILRLPTASHAAADGGLAAAIAERIDEARGTGTFGTAREESLLARSGRGAADWLRGMRTLAAGANADHRTAPVDPERVWRVLENPAADPSARVGAAAMLAATGTEETRTRLRVVARGITAPKVRVAMTAIAEGDDEEAMIEALEAVEERRGPAVIHASGVASRRPAP